MRVAAGLPLLILLCAAPAFAQPVVERLFVDLPARGASAALDLSGSSRSAVVTSRAVGMRIDRLFATDSAPVPRIELNIADNQWIARFERLDRDIAGFRSWVGSIEGIAHSHVVFTERDGVVAGLVNAVSTTFQVRTDRPGTYWLERIDTSRLRGEGEPLLSSPGPAHAGSAPSLVAADDGNTIDVLVLYTPSARTAAGGAAQIQAIASQIITDSNTIYLRSGITPRIRLAGTSELAFTEASNMSSDLSTVTNSATARALRDSARADVVQLLVSSPDPNTCGVAWLLTSLDETNFNAYSVSDIACIPQYTPTHEMAHNMGAHHAPEDGASGALFDYSYGYKDPQSRFRTVMAYQCPTGCPRIPNFSNPALVVTGPPVNLRADVEGASVTLSWRSSGESATGTALQNNALTINLSAATVASFRLPAATTPVLVAGPAPSVTSYMLQVRSDSSGAYDVFDGPVGTATIVAGVLPPGNYDWRVFSANSGGASQSADAQFTVGATCSAPGAPRDFAFSSTGQTVSLNWLAPATGTAPTGYTIEAGSATGLANLYNAPTGSAAPGAVAQAPPGTYFVRIRARNACGTSAASNERVIAVP